MHENKVLITFVPEDAMYTHSKVMYIAGRENAKEGDLGAVMLPVHAKDVNIDPAIPDTAVFSYSNTEDGVIRLRVVAVKMEHTYSGGAISSTCRLTVIVPSVEGNWITRTLDARLVLPSTTSDALFNPHGLAEDGDCLYFIDYESRRITVVKKDDLEGAADNANVEVLQSLDLNALPNPVKLPANAKGQAIIAMSGKIIALYIVADAAATEHDPGRLLRLDINTNGTLDDTPVTIAHTLVGKNPQSIIPVTTTVNNAKVTKLLIPAIGGAQDYYGGTNGTRSNISVVDALGTWPEEAQIIVTGDPLPEQKKDTPTPPEATAYNILGIGAAMRGGTSLVYILAQVYVDGGKGAYWMLYLTTADALLSLLPQTGNPPTLSQAVANPNVNFSVIDEGISIAPEYVPDPAQPDAKVPYAIWFWGIVYEQALRDDDQEDRVYLFLGSPFLITKAEAYSSPTTTQLNPYVVISGFGGVNVNSVDVTIETLHQAVRKVSLHRGVRAARVAVAAAAAEGKGK
jgi:hypothetical protein